MKKKILIPIFILLILLVIIGIFYGAYRFIRNKQLNKSYDITFNIHSIIKIKDDYFDENKDSKDKDYDLVLVTFEMVNNSAKNYSESIVLKTSNNNEYGTCSEELVNEFLSTSGHSTDGDILGNQTKRCTIPFWIPKNEMDNDTTFTISTFMNNTNYKKTSFKNTDIKESNNLKEIFYDDEIDIATQKVALYNTAKLVKTLLNNQSFAWNNNDIQTLHLQLNIVITLLEGKHPINWNSQISDNGYSIEFNKCKEYFPSLENDINTILQSKDIQKSASESLEKYNRLNAINYTEYTNNVTSLFNICNQIMTELKNI